MSSPLSIERLPLKPFAFAWYVSRQHKGWATAAICAVLVAQLLGSLFAVFLKYFTDAVIAAADSGSFTRAWLWGAALPVIYFFMENIWRISGFTGMRWLTGVRAQAHRVLFQYLTRHSAGYFGSRFSGALVNKIGNAAHGANDLLSGFLWEYLPLLLSFVAIFVITVLAHWHLGAILLIWLAIFLAINIFMVRKKYPYAYEAAQRGSELRGKMVDAASNITAIHASGQQELEHAYVDRFIEQHRKADIKNWWHSEWILVTNGGLLTVFTAAMILVSVRLLEADAITIGTMVMIISIVFDLQRSLFFIGQKMTSFMDVYGQMREGLGEILVAHDIVDLTDAAPLLARGGDIHFDAVRFSYGKGTVFQDFTLHIPAGQKVGLVGRSGAGKTTLVSLLLRHYDVTEGSIFIDGQDIRNVTLKSLRRSIASVAQDVSLFHRTIRENIRYGKPEATDQQVEDVAKLAQAHEFIESLPLGYETLVGERGVKLSGGQRQRIVIARAMIKQAPILMLDEATSALDSESEAAIQAALTILMKGKTVLAIAHRLSTLRSMDRIIVLDQGRIMEDGNHEELIKSDGLYAQLWKGQVSGFIQE